MPSFQSLSGSILIIGAGNFGVATALSLIDEEPTRQITLIDSAPFPSPRAASNDINKIIRPDYADPVYMTLMQQAIKGWQTNPLYTPWYYETGHVRADPTGFGEGCFEAYKKLGIDPPASWLTVDEVHRRWGGSLSGFNCEGVERCYWNPKSGWADAVTALEVITQTTIDKGVAYRVETVCKLIIESDEICKGVKLENGEEVYADTVLLAAGARTAVLLADSAPQNKNIQAGDRLIATGAVSFYAKADSNLQKKYKDVPVIKSTLKHTKGESMALTPDGILKFNCDISFTNMSYHAASDQEMSIPPDKPSQYTWTASDFPRSLKERSRRTMEGCYGKDMEGLEISEYRMCWDATTPRHDFLITHHPHCKHLYIATGGSFHGWKFLPVIGPYIVRMMKGELDGVLADRWAWDPKNKDDHVANPTYQIETDLQKILDEDKSGE